MAVAGGGEKSQNGVDVRGLCPSQRMSHPGGHPALSSSSLSPRRAVVGFPAWTPRKAVSVRGGSGRESLERECSCFCARQLEMTPCSSYTRFWGGSILTVL